MKLTPLSKVPLRATALVTGRLFFGMLLGYSALIKFQNPAAFLEAVYAYDLLGPLTGMAIAMLIPALEMTLAVALIMGIFIDGALLLTTAMLFAFGAVLLSAVQRGLDIACACFALSDTLSPSTLVNMGDVMRTGLLALLSLALFLASTKGAKSAA